MKARVMLARFPGNSSEHPDSSNWIMETLVKCQPTDLIKSRRTGPGFRVWKSAHPQMSEIIVWNESNTPIDMVRNRCVDDAQKFGVDYLLMIDSDMSPDEPNVGAQPFWETAWNFIYRRGAPAVIAAPYVGPGWNQNIFVFRWRNFNNWNPTQFKLDQYSREEAEERGGIERVAALPTGLILFDMRVFERLKPPYFYYEFDKKHTRKESTEDVTITRDIALNWSTNPEAGCFCAWDCWAEHVKLTNFGKPDRINVEAVGKQFKTAFEMDKHAGERLVSVGDDAALEYPKFPPLSAEELAKIAAGRQSENLGRLVTVDQVEFEQKVRELYPEVTDVQDI